MPASPKCPVRFKILVQVAVPGDITDDATVHWPESRELVELGVIELTEPGEGQRRGAEADHLRSHSTHRRHRSLRRSFARVARRHLPAQRPPPPRPQNWKIGAVNRSHCRIRLPDRPEAAGSRTGRDGAGDRSVGSAPAPGLRGWARRRREARDGQQWGGSTGGGPAFLSGSGPARAVHRHEPLGCRGKLDERFHLCAAHSRFHRRIRPTGAGINQDRSKPGPGF